MNTFIYEHTLSMNIFIY